MGLPTLLVSEISGLFILLLLLFALECNCREDTLYYWNLFTTLTVL